MKVEDERFLRALYDLKYLFADKWIPATWSHSRMAPCGEKRSFPLSAHTPSAKNGRISTPFCTIASWRVR
jgi:hypothetical protein